MFIAKKSYTGLEGRVMKGQRLDPAALPTLDNPVRVDQLKRNGLIEDYDKAVAPAARTQALRSPAEPPGMVSPNVGGIRELGWTPGGPPGDGTRGDGETEAGNEGGAAAGEAIAPIGSSTSPTAEPSSSPPVPPPPASTSTESARPARGNRNRR